MMKKITLILGLFTLTFGLFAQEQTPNNGEAFTLADLANDYSNVFSNDNGIYTMQDEFEISDNDSLVLNAGEELHIDEDLRLVVIGTFLSEGTEDNKVMIDAIEADNPYEGIRFEENSTADIDYTIVQNGGGLRVITANFTITNSEFYDNVEGINSSAVINLSNGSPIIKNNTFINNDYPAVGSGANSDVAAIIQNNYIKDNGQENPNRPQINMGSTGADTLKIIKNEIIGDRDMDMVGGISVANLVSGTVNTIIKENIIRDNRFGINVQGVGNSYYQIEGNIIEDNDTQGQPMAGGSGIAISSAAEDQEVLITKNEIRGNLWGISNQGNSSVNVGDDDIPGQNIFSENKNGGQTYALYNNGPKTVMAKYNCWIEGEEITLEDAAEVIMDQEDDDDLGEVIYDPVDCEFMGMEDFEKEAISIYPNPATNHFNISGPNKINSVSIYSLSGKRVYQTDLKNNEEPVHFNLNPGVYIVELKSSHNKHTQKLIVD